jgi:hypothetical protein
MRRKNARRNDFNMESRESGVESLESREKGRLPPAAPRVCISNRYGKSRVWSRESGV